MASPSDGKPKSPPEVGGKKGCCGCGGCASCAPAEPIVGMAKPHQRKCRDGLCCVVFLLFWVGMITIGAIGLKYGQPGRLLYGVDYKGQTCGMGDLSSKKFTAYPRMNDDFLLNLAKNSPLDYKFYGVCVSSCPGTLSVVCNYEDAGINSAAATNPYTQDVLLQCLTNATYSPPTGVACSSVKSTCWVVPLQTSSVMYRCLPVYNTTNAQGSVCSYPPGITSPSDPACLLVIDSKSGTTERPAKTSQVIDSMSTARATVGRWFSDLYRAWWVILVCAIGAAAVFGFVWLLLAKWCTGVFVWGTITLVLAR
jgi:choline transporter-like protein 2/4/5